ncbi:FG-GAP repeat domain-containing protein [Chondromyces apiculatus]|uniref:FG-GAP repeat protein n=1 Tax=Chondromyces apiculatus DSM 436 TaxID=1192034 RepID=A0A017T0L1_9BACT|nr:VCBS repeat-containing protein [Chondromyces apiculatus]EYF02768.1 Hypothetical protein CAP_6503 [Chondromyces apiculatus DSM 436]
MVLGASLLAPSGCVDYPRLEGGVCGDGFIDEAEGEDCDGASITPDIPGYEGPSFECTDACRLKCEPKSPACLQQHDLVSKDMKDPCCPPGWGCGTDGSCRQAGTTFRPGPKVETEVGRLFTADFDGDGKQEVLAATATTVTVHHLDGEVMRESLRTAFAGQAVISADLNASTKVDAFPREELLLAIGNGIGVLDADEEHVFTPRVYPVELLTDMDEPLVSERDWKMVLASNGDAHANTLDDVFIVTSRSVIAIDQEPGEQQFQDDEVDLRWPIAVANVDPSTDCEELLIPLKRAGSLVLHVHDPCADPGAPALNWAFDGEGGVAPELAGPVQAFDLDHDGHPEVAVGLKVGGEEKIQIHVLHHVSGHFEEGICVDALTPAVASLCGAAPVLLAIGDLDGDLVPDYVDPCQVVMSANLSSPATPAGECLSGGESAGYRVYNTERPWGAAIMHELNGDAHPDVVAVSPGGTALAFFRGTEEGLLNPSGIPAGMAVGQMVRGDFDGDSIADIGLLEDVARGSEAGVRLAFGRHLTAPAPPVLVGRVQDGVQLVTGDYRPLSAASDGMTDLAVLSVGNAVSGEEGSFMTFFAGNASRSLQSTMMLSTDLLVSGDVPKLIAVGYFRKPREESTATKGIAAVGLDLGGGASELSSRMWWIGLDKDGDPPPPSERQVTVPQDSATKRVIEAQVAIMRRSEKPDRLVLGVPVSDEAFEIHVFDLVTDGAVLQWVPAFDPVELTGRLVPGSLTAVDINKDGTDDLSLITDSGPNSAVNELRVLWGDENDLSVPLDSPLLQSCADSSGVISSVVWTELSSDYEMLEGVVLAADGGCIIAPPDPSEGECDTDTSEGTACNRVTILKSAGAFIDKEPALFKGATLALGDVDGDGLLDLIAADATSFRVFFRQPENP